jgi:hypothetical protein
VVTELQHLLWHGNGLTNVDAEGVDFLR